jgi:hypothetical protein
MQSRCPPAQDPGGQESGRRRLKEIATLAQPVADGAVYMEDVVGAAIDHQRECGAKAEPHKQDRVATLSLLQKYDSVAIRSSSGEDLLPMIRPRAGGTRCHVDDHQ